MLQAPIIFTKLVVADLDKSLAFYAAVAGLTERQRIETDLAGRPMTEALLGSGEQAAGLNLIHFPQERARISGEVVIGFRTDDVDAASDLVVKHGGALLGDRVVAVDHGITYKVQMVTDPEGHILEILEIGQ